MDGLLIVDKPCGITSHDVVHRLRKITSERSIGHLGTLDPLATGVLPMLLGRYTRLARFFSAREKEYSGRMRFGIATDTYDSMGEVTAQTPGTAVDAAQLQSIGGGISGTHRASAPGILSEEGGGRAGPQAGAQGRGAGAASGSD